MAIADILIENTAAELGEEQGVYADLDAGLAVIDLNGVIGSE